MKSGNTVLPADATEFHPSPGTAGIVPMMIIDPNYSNLEKYYVYI
jgi:hypothetical protein